MGKTHEANMTPLETYLVIVLLSSRTTSPLEDYRRATTGLFASGARHSQLSVSDVGDIW